MTGPLLVTAWLSSPLAGDPPQLDSLLEWSLAPFEVGFQDKQKRGVPHHHIDRSLPAPEQGVIRIPLYRKWLGGFLIAQCSDAIMPAAKADAVDHICKRIAVEHSGLLADDERKVVSTTNSWTKSYRMPLRIRLIERVAWFAFGTRSSVRKALRDIHAIGKKVADGYGRVREWIVEDIAEDRTWFAKSNGGTVLMRTLPRLIDGKAWLPDDLIGYKRHFGACCPPYWHQERFGEIVVPC